jgi:hypothetical protein
MKFDGAYAKNKVDGERKEYTKSLQLSYMLHKAKSKEKHLEN